MGISVTCSSCGKTLSAPDALAGKKAQCSCGAVIVVPAASSAPVPAQAPRAAGVARAGSIRRSAPGRPVKKPAQRRGIARSLHCQFCENGRVVGKKEFRFSTAVVVIGFILLVPSLIAALYSVYMLVRPPDLAGAMNEALQEQMLDAKIPEEIVTKVSKGEELTEEQKALLTKEQSDMLEQMAVGQVMVMGGQLGDAVGKVVAVVLLAISLVFLSVGIVLTWRKKMFRCTSCGQLAA